MAERCKKCGLELRYCPHGQDGDSGRDEIDRFDDGDTDG